MKYLKIENNKGYLLNEKGTWIELDKVTKEDILFIVSKTLDEEGFAMDQFIEENLQNPAHNNLQTTPWKNFRFCRKKIST